MNQRLRNLKRSESKERFFLIQLKVIEHAVALSLNKKNKQKRLFNKN